MTRLVSTLLLGLIAIYRAVISPWLPRRCRFAPTCSAYAREAIEVHGPWKGAGLAIARVARCHPWHAGGHDPVPPHETPHRADHMIDHGVDHRADHPGHRCA